MNNDDTMPNQLVSPRSEIVSRLRANGGYNTEDHLARAVGLTREETLSVVDAMVQEGLVEIAWPRGRWGRIVRLTTSQPTSCVPESLDPNEPVSLAACDGYNDLDCPECSEDPRPVDEELEQALALLDEIEQCKSRLADAEQAFRDYAEEYLYRRVADYRA